MTEQQELELLAEVVRRMPLRPRQVLTMRKTYGFTHEEISERLGISLPTVEKCLQEAVLALADGLFGRAQ